MSWRRSSAVSASSRCAARSLRCAASSATPATRGSEPPPSRPATRLGVWLVTLLGAINDEVPGYGSGGFCSYSNEQRARQLAGWVDEGIPRVKMKVGREPRRDLDRVRVARLAIGADAELYVDA